LVRPETYNQMIKRYCSALTRTGHRHSG
jgi:hypothetical protein